MTEEELVLVGLGPIKLFGWWTGLVSAACVFALTFLVAALAASFAPFGTVVRGAFAAATLASVASLEMHRDLDVY